MTGRSAGTAPWGEGYADDGWSAFAAVDRWEQLTPDEYIRFFPRLGDRAGAPPAEVGQHLTEAVAVRVWRRGPDGLGLSLAGLDPCALAALGCGAADRWFAPPSRLGRAMGWLAGRRPARTDDTAALQQLAGLVAILREGRVPAYTEKVAMVVAFHGGLHPAYLWSEALAWADSGTALGWLGVLARGWAAFMPAEAAAPIIDAVVPGPDGTARLRDARFAACGLSPAQWGALARAAHAAAEGHGTVVRLIPAGRRAPARTGTNDPALPAAAATSR